MGKLITDKICDGFDEMERLCPSQRQLTYKNVDVRKL